jgi:hypothetical protein
MYCSPFLWLNDAANLIARQLASTHPTMYPDEISALDNARRQLIRALFDGAVHSANFGVSDRRFRFKPAGGFG